MVRNTRRAFAVLVAIAPLLAGMGGGGAGTISDTIPRPKENFRVDLLDRQGVLTRVDHLSCGGRTFFPLERGEGTLTVPFAKALRVKMGEAAGARVAASIQTGDAKTLEGTLPLGLVCTSETEFGNFQIETRGLREITFARP